VPQDMGGRVDVPSHGASNNGRINMRDPRRAKNIRTGLLLAAVALSFFIFIIVKFVTANQ
jgi:hypothetical protein